MCSSSFNAAVWYSGRPSASVLMQDRVSGKEKPCRKQNLKSPITKKSGDKKVKVKTIFLAGTAVGGVGLLLVAVMLPAVSFVIGKAEAIAYERYYAPAKEPRARPSASYPVGPRDVSVVAERVHRLRERQGDQEARQRAEESRKKRKDWFRKNGPVLAAHIRSRRAALHESAVSYIRAVAPAAFRAREAPSVQNMAPWSATRLSMSTLFGQ
jgi:hypothetical protein